MRKEWVVVILVFTIPLHAARRTMEEGVGVWVFGKGGLVYSRPSRVVRRSARWGRVA